MRTYSEWIAKFGVEPIGIKSWKCRVGQHTFYDADRTISHVTRCMQCGLVMEEQARATLDS